MTKLKPKKPSTIEFVQKYANNPDACRDVLFQALHPNGWECPVCHHKQYKLIRGGKAVECSHCSTKDYLLAGTIFRDNKLPLFKLLLGIYLFFVSNKGISAVELRNHLDVNIKTAQLLCRKCRILMQNNEEKHKLDSLFYEADGIYIGAKSKEPGHQGSGTQQQAVMMILATGEENEYPHGMKLYPIKTDDGATTERVLAQAIEMSKERKLNTDGKPTFNVMSKYLEVESEKVDYSQKGHRMYWLNIIVGNIQNHINGIYHGVNKRDMYLFLIEQEFRFNYRFIGSKLLDKIAEMLAASIPCPRKAIIRKVDQMSLDYIKV